LQILGEEVEMQQMQPQTVVIIAGALVVVGLLVWALARRQKSARLASHFGPEYERVVNRVGDKAKAEAELAERARRHATLHIVELPPADRERFAREWAETQSRFVDNPTEAIAEADRLVAEAMRRRGYPMVEFEQRAADISVDYPELVENYRTGHAVAAATDRGQSDTEDLRRAMVAYRALFAELLGAHEPDLVAARR
jgi:hypothetical protein